MSKAFPIYKPRNCTLLYCMSCPSLYSEWHPWPQGWDPWQARTTFDQYSIREKLKTMDTKNKEIILIFCIVVNEGKIFIWGKSNLDKWHFKVFTYTFWWISKYEKFNPLLYFLLDFLLWHWFISTFLQYPYVTYIRWGSRKKRIKVLF